MATILIAEDERAINDLAAALNGKEEDYNAECGSHPGASGC